MKFDKEAEYDALISPLMDQVIAICKEHRIPMLASFNFAHGRTPDADDFATTYLHNGGAPPWAPDELIEALRIIRRGASTRTKVFAVTICGSNTCRCISTKDCRREMAAKVVE